jgi:hypothetical protein
MENKWRWELFQAESGDIDVMPAEGGHVRGAKCTCNPVVQIIGAAVLTVHRSFDKREFIEQAIEIINGDEDV